MKGIKMNCCERMKEYIEENDIDKQAPYIFGKPDMEGSELSGDWPIAYETEIDFCPFCGEKFTDM